ncbi:MAG: transposase [Candidatus Thermoplasmatota archaeon]|nr:transposase [Candidatus Thermoplasmatota archaeon]
MPFIVQWQSKKGTNNFIRFATIAVVEDGKRFTLKVLPVTPLSRKEHVVEELIRYTQQLVSIKVILFDRGFYTNAVIETVKNMDVPFVMPAVKNNKVKAAMERAYQDGPFTYEMSDGATYTMVTANDEDNDKLLPYATTMKIDAATAHELYTHRFGIETQYRVKNKFLGRTCSKQYSVRYAFFVLAVTLYNLWVLLNIAERGRNGLEPGKIPIKVDQLKHINRLVIYQRAPG